jgi:hypothetical protein
MYKICMFRLFDRTYYIILVFMFMSAHCHEAYASSCGCRRDISFSQASVVDQKAIDQRDRSEPFFFEISNVGGGGALPFTVDKGSNFRVWLDRRTPGRAGNMARSLALTLSSDVDDDVKDKIFFDAVPWKSQTHLSAIGDARERFVSFDIDLAKPYDKPKYWVIHMQAWQCCGGHPPLVLAVVPGQSDESKITLEFAVRNDDSERENYGQEIQLAKFVVERDRWLHVAMDLEPAPIGGPMGKVRAWIDGKMLVDWKGHWAYAPTSLSQVTHGELRPDIGIDLGIYRRRQPGMQTVLIDNIKYGDSIKDIDLQ